MKAAARDFRDIIVHIDVVADYVHRQTTSGSTDATVLENRTSVSGYKNHSKPAVTEEHVSETDVSRDRNRKCKSTNDDAYNAANHNNVMELFPETKETAITLSNMLADSNNNRRVYKDSTACNSTDEQPCLVPVSRKTINSGGIRVRHCRMVTASTQTMPQSVSQNAKVHRVASRVCRTRTTEVVCAVVTPRDEGPPTTGSDQSNYSGIYERDLEEILESIAKVNCRHVRRHHHRAAAVRSSNEHGHQLSFRLPRSPEIQDYRSSSDSCYERSDSESDPEGNWTSEDELDSDDDPTAAAFNSGSFFRRLNRLLLSGNRGPEMAAIKP